MYKYRSDDQELKRSSALIPPEIEVYPGVRIDLTIILNNYVITCTVSITRVIGLLMPVYNQNVKMREYMMCRENSRSLGPPNHVCTRPPTPNLPYSLYIVNQHTHAHAHMHAYIIMYSLVP